MAKTRYRWLLILLSLLLIAYLTFQITRSLITNIETETAVYYTQNSVISAQGYVFRNEGLIKSTESGVLRYTVPDGSRVSNGGVIAERYSTEDEVRAREQVIRLEQQIEALKALQNKQTAANIDISTLDKQIFESYLNALQSSGTGNTVVTSSYFDSVLGLINKKQIISGEVKNFSARISTLEAAAAELKSKYNALPNSIVSTYSGYFIRKADGLESVISFDKIENITVSEINAFAGADKVSTEGIIGKIVSDYDWYIVVKLNIGDLFSLNEGAEMEMSIPFAGVDSLPVTVTAINRDDLSGDAAVVFKCSNMNSDLAAIRTQPVNILLNKIKGLRIPKRAARYNKKIQGVYVMKGSIAEFCKIDVLYSGSDFYIIKDNGAVHLYDEIITKGKKLSDGKVLR